MTFVLILHFEFAGQRHSMAALIARDAQVCQIAGGGMAQVLEAAKPGLSVGWTCQPAGVAA
jgi:hypothetical protein